jgi:hypothetical protein
LQGFNHRQRVAVVAVGRINWHMPVAKVQPCDLPMII